MNERWSPSHRSNVEETRAKQLSVLANVGIRTLEPGLSFTLPPSTPSAVPSIRGYEFQFHYSAYLVTELLVPGGTVRLVRMESIEDVDVLHQYDDHITEEYIQVKTRGEGLRPWTLKELVEKGVIDRFAAIAAHFGQESPNDRRLLLTFVCDGDIHPDLATDRDEVLLTDPRSPNSADPATLANFSARLAAYLTRRLDASIIDQCVDLSSRQCTQLSTALAAMAGLGAWTLSTGANRSPETLPHSVASQIADLLMSIKSKTTVRELCCGAAEAFGAEHSNQVVEDWQQSLGGLDCWQAVLDDPPLLAAVPLLAREIASTITTAVSAAISVAPCMRIISRLGTVHAASSDGDAAAVEFPIDRKTEGNLRLCTDIPEDNLKTVTAWLVEQIHRRLREQLTKPAVQLMLRNFAAVEQPTIPALPEYYITRQTELDILDDAFQEAPTVVLCGPPKYGKTSLAAEYASSRLDTSPVFWHTIGDARDEPRLLAAKVSKFVSDEVGVRSIYLDLIQHEISSKECLRRSKIALRSSGSLVCIDNVEQLADADAAIGAVSALAPSSSEDLQLLIIAEGVNPPTFLVSEMEELATVRPSPFDKEDDIRALAENLGVTFDDTAGALIPLLTVQNGGHPWLIVATLKTLGPKISPASLLGLFDGLPKDPSVQDKVNSLLDSMLQRRIQDRNARRLALRLSVLLSRDIDESLASAVAHVEPEVSEFPMSWRAVKRELLEQRGPNAWRMAPTFHQHLRSYVSQEETQSVYLAAAEHLTDWSPGQTVAGLDVLDAIFYFSCAHEFQRATHYLVLVAPQFFTDGRGTLLDLYTNVLIRKLDPSVELLNVHAIQYCIKAEADDHEAAAQSLKKIRETALRLPDESRQPALFLALYFVASVLYVMGMPKRASRVFAEAYFVGPEGVPKTQRKFAAMAAVTIPLLGEQPSADDLQFSWQILHQVMDDQHIDWTSEDLGALEGAVTSYAFFMTRSDDNEGQIRSHLTHLSEIKEWAQEHHLSSGLQWEIDCIAANKHLALGNKQAAAAGYRAVVDPAYAERNPIAAHASHSAALCYSDLNQIPDAIANLDICIEILEETEPGPYHSLYAPALITRGAFKATTGEQDPRQDLFAGIHTAIQHDDAEWAARGIGELVLLDFRAGELIEGLRKICVLFDCLSMKQQGAAHAKLCLVPHWYMGKDQVGSEIVSIGEYPENVHALYFLPDEFDDLVKTYATDALTLLSLIGHCAYDHSELNLTVAAICTALELHPDEAWRRQPLAGTFANVWLGEDKPSPQAIDDPRVALICGLHWLYFDNIPLALEYFHRAQDIAPDSITAALALRWATYAVVTGASKHPGLFAPSRHQSGAIGRAVAEATRILEQGSRLRDALGCAQAHYRAAALAARLDLTSEIRDDMDRLTTAVEDWQGRLSHCLDEWEQSA